MNWHVLIPSKLMVIIWVSLMIPALMPDQAATKPLETDKFDHTNKFDHTDNAIKNVRLWKSPRRTRIVLDLTQAPHYEFFSLTDPDRAVIDLTLARAEQNYLALLTSIDALDLNQSAIDNIRSDAKANQRLRIVFDLKKHVEPKHFYLPPNTRYGHRLVIDFHSESRLISTEQDPILELMEQLKAAKQTPNQDPSQANHANNPRPVIVAIDAGHGGEDPGAIGHSGTQEKDIVLSIAKRLANEINREPGMKAVLIRTSDYYIGLHKRRQNAQRLYQADLFISLHADAWYQKTARGASVFVLSNTGASSTRARYLAKKENAADQIGGVFEQTQNPVLKQVLVDLAINGSMDHSVSASQSVLHELGKVTKLHKPRVEKAGFAVLKTAQMPAMLVELGFITNPTEERLLRKASHQKKLAKAIHNGIKTYFKKQPPPNSYFADRGTLQPHLN